MKVACAAASARWTCKSCAVIECASESPVVEQSFGCAIEHNAHAIEKIDDARRGLAHALHQGLIRQKIPAIDRVVEVFIDRVAFALLIFCRIDAALGANRMGTLHGHDREEIDWYARLRNADGGHEAGQTSAYNYDLWLSHLVGR